MANVMSKGILQSFSIDRYNINIYIKRLNIIEQMFAICYNIFV